MRILKIINNNIVSSVDQRGKEVVVMGRGIGFKKRPGEDIDLASVEKIFILPEESTSRFEELVADIPYEHMQLAEEIIYYAKKTLGKKLSKNIYITLTDHLNYAIERRKQGIDVHNALLWEIQKFYPREYAAGLHALDMVKEKTGGIELPVDEAAFIALHFVNAEMDTDMKQSASMPGMIKDILNIIRYMTGQDLDEKTLAYERLITHLKFYLQRVVKNETYQEDDEEIQKTIREHCPEEYECALKIKDYVMAKIGHETTEEELIYLTIHINRVCASRRREDGQE